MTTQELEYLVKVNDRDLGELKKRISDTNKALGRDTPAAASKASTSFRSIGTGAKVAAAGILGGLAVAAKIGFGELMEGQEVAAQTSAVLKSTGGAANVTAGDVEKLAGKLSRLSGVDDEVIQSGENLLLTFTNIRNETGRGNDVFNQATGIMLDMSVALGQDTKSSAVQLGKALNDPIRGVTALQRVGVTFTEKQREQIKTLVESGRTLDAQKLILGELKKEFGGSAAAAGGTFSGAINKAKNAAEGLLGSLVTGLLPAFTTLVTTGQGVVDFLSRHEQATKIAALALAGLAVGVFAVGGALKVYRAVTLLASAAQVAFNVALGANPIGLIVIALVALAAAFVVAYQKSETFREIVHRIGEAIMSVLGPAFDWLKTTAASVADGIRAHWDEIRATAQTIWTAVKTIIETAWNLIKPIVQNAIGFIKGTVENGLRLVGSIIKTVMAIIRGDWSAAWDGIKGIASAIWGQIKNVASTLFNGIKAVISGVWEAVKSLTSAVWEGIKSLVSGIWNGLKSLASSVWNGIKSAITTPTNAVKETLTDVWNGVKGKLGDVWDSIKSKAKTVWDGVKSVISTAVNAAESVLNGFKSFLSTVVGAFQGVVDAAQTAFGWIGKVKDAAEGSILPGGVNIPGIPFLASGGRLAAGQAAVVGERGPELWIPDRPGRVVSNDDSAGLLARAGEQITVHVERMIVRDDLDATLVGSALASRLAVLR